MSNSLGTLYGSLILQEALQLTFRERPELKTLAMGFRDLDGKADGALLNQPVVSRILTVATVNNFGTGATARSDTDVTAKLVNQREIHHAFTPTEYNSTNRDLIRESAKPIAVGLANYIVDSVRNLWNETNFPNTDGLHAPITVGAAWSRANTTRPFRKAMQKAGIPKAARFQVYNSDVYDSLLGDSLIVAALNNPSNQDAIRTGNLPAVDGCGLSEYPDLSRNVGAAIAFTGVAATDLCTAVAHGLVTSDRVNFVIGAGLAGLVTTTSYYVIKVSADTFKLATTAANAAAGTAIDITSDGNGTLTDCLIGFAGTPDASVYLARPMKNPQELMPNVPYAGLCEYMEDPITGFRVLVTQWIDQATLNANTRISWLDGYSVGNPNNGLLLYNK